MSLALRTTLVVVSALLYALAFRGGAASLVAWFAIAPLLVALRGASLGATCALGAAWGMAIGFGIAEPFPPSISQYFERPAWVGWAFAAFLFASMASPYYAAFALLDRGLARFHGRSVGPLLVACTWVALEWARGRLFTETVFFIGNPWGLVGYSQLALLPLVQFADHTGIYGPSFLVVLANATWAQLIVRWRSESRVEPARLGRALAIAFVPVAAAWVYGTTVLPSEARPHEPDGVRIAVVQADLDLGSVWKREFYGRNLSRYLELTRDVARRERPRIVFWPEGAFTFFVENEPSYRKAMAVLLGAYDAELIAGGPAREEDAGGDPFRNRIFALAPNGDITGRYDKEHLVPFSEYVPFRAVDPMRRDFEGTRAYGHGTRTAPLPSRAGPIGVLTCNEALLAEVAADRVRDGAVVLANPSNDSWVAERDFARRMLEHVAFRSIELRRYLVRPSTEGPSAIVDPWGRIQERTPHGESATLAGTIAPRGDLSVYARFGDWFPALTSAIVALAIASELRRRVDSAR